MQKFSNQTSTLIFSALVIFSAFTSWFIVNHNFPYIGLSIFFAVLATFVYVLKRPKYAYDTILYGSILVLSFFLLYRSSESLTFLNVVAITFLGSVLTINKKNKLSFIEGAFSPLNAVSRIFTTDSQFHFNKELFKHPANFTRHVNFTQLFYSLVITLGLLIVIIPLLASANPLFKSLVENVFKSLNIEAILKFIFGESMEIHIARIMLAFIIFGIATRLSSYSSIDQSDESSASTIQKEVVSTIFLIPKIAISIVIFVFFITQLQLYLANEATLAALNYTNSKQVNEVFAQLTIVSLIIFALIYNDKNRSYISTLFTYILIAEGLFLGLIALKSDYDYSTRWGFTHKRLYGYAVVFWTLSTYLLFLYKYVQNNANWQFVKNTVVLSAFTLIMVNVANFDYLIYHYNKSTTHAGVDYYFLSKLSSDSYSYHDQLKALMAAPPKPEVQSATYSLLRKIELLQNKYKEFDIREFNIAEYMQYTAIKDVDVRLYRDKMNKKGPFNFSG